MTTAPNPPPNQDPEEIQSQTPPPQGEGRRRIRLRLPERRPLVTYTILVITVLVYLLQMATEFGLLTLPGLACPWFQTGDLAACYGLKVNQLILQGQWWRLITPILLHGSILHIGFNMYALYILGPELETHYGHRSFLALYLTSGFAGFVVSFLLTDAPSLGASTAIFGLLAAQGVFVFRNRQIFGRRANLVLRSIINIALINFLIGLSPGIDNWGHFGGLLGGALFAWFASPNYRLEGSPPDVSLEDQNPRNRWLLAGLAVLLIFGAAAAGSIWGYQLR